MTLTKKLCNFYFLFLLNLILFSLLLFFFLISSVVDLLSFVILLFFNLLLFFYSVSNRIFHTSQRVTVGPVHINTRTLCLKSRCLLNSPEIHPLLLGAESRIPKLIVGARVCVCV